MPAIVATHYIGNPEIENGLRMAVQRLFEDEKGDWMIGFIGSQSNDIWEMSVESPNGGKWRPMLDGTAGEHKVEFILSSLQEILASNSNYPA